MTTTDLGTTLERGFQPGERYDYDFGGCSYRNGWAQIDTSQDAAYFGIWTNPTTRQIFTYCEGDLTRETAPDDASYRAAIVQCLTFYTGPWGPWSPDRPQERHPHAMIDAKLGGPLAPLFDRFVSLGLASYLH